MIEFIILVLVLVFLGLIAGVGVGAVALIKLRQRVANLESSVVSLSAKLTGSGAAQPGPQVSNVPQRPVATPAAQASGQPLLPETKVAQPPFIPSVTDKGYEKPSSPQPLRSIPQPVPLTDDRINAFERLIGTRWLNWAGALVLLVGTAFLLKFLYDRGWVGPAGRVAIGMGIGVGLLFIGEVRLRRFHDLFSQSVSAAGCGALFLTAFLSFKFYEFSGRTATFALLCWFAAFTVALAVVRRGQILAYLGLIAAYLAPYLLSTGQDQAEALFCYLAVLAVAAAGVQAARNWQGIATLCLAFSWIYYVGWYVSFCTPARFQVAATGAAGLVFFVGGGTLIRSLLTRKALRVEETIVLAAAFILGTYHLWDVLSERHEQVLGFVLCALSLAAVAALKSARRRQVATALFESAILALASGSLLLVIPACLKADGAMLAWALGAIVLVDMGARSGHLLFDIAAGICLVAGPWVGLGQGVTHTALFIPVANRIFLAWFGTILAWFLAGRRYLRTADGRSYRRIAGMALQVASSFFIVALLSIETYSWFEWELRAPGAALASLKDWRTAILCVVWALYPLSWLRWARLESKLLLLSVAHYAVLGLAFISVMVVFHYRETWVFLNPVFFSALLFPAGIFLISGKVDGDSPRMKSALQIYAHLLCVILISVELYQGLHLSAWSATSLRWFHMASISAAWAAYATILLGAGISRNLLPWRWLALGLLGATLLKVIFVDMAEVRQIWRVVSFMVLGALLMVCSYAYSRHERAKRLAGAASATGKEVTR